MVVHLLHFSDLTFFDLGTYLARGFVADWDYKNKFIILNRPETGPTLNPPCPDCQGCGCPVCEYTGGVL